MFETAPVADVWLVRHGEIGEAYRGRYVGRLDPPLSAAGLEHARALGRRRELAPPGWRVSSPLLRARQTAEAGAAGAPVELDPDLREIDFGRWEGWTFAEMAAADAGAVERWARLDPAFRFPEGESPEEFRLRVARAAGRIQSAPGGRAYVFTHGGVIRVLLCHWLGLAPEAHLAFDVRPASLTHVRLFGGRGVLCGFNDRCHIAEAEL